MEICDFDTVALYLALDEQRTAQQLTWTGVAREIWQLSFVLNDQRSDHPISPSTIPNMAKRGNISCQHALFMLRWLERAPESFLAGPAVREDATLPVVGPDRRLRWNLKRLFESLNTKRQREELTWPELAIVLRCSPNQLTGLRTAKFATNMTLAMRITQWLDQPGADFIYAAKW
jgi:hypothetical protein